MNVLWFAKFCCCYFIRANTPVSQRWSRKAAPSSPFPPLLSLPAQWRGPDGLCSREMLCYLLLMPSPSELSSHAACLNGTIHQPFSICPRSQCAHSFLLLSALFFTSSVQSEFHYSLSSQCLSTSTFIHINSEWQRLTICWGCWQQIVS